MSQEKTKDEIIAMLSEKARTEGDNFRVKVFRLNGMGGVPETVVTLSSATLRHFDSPEEWVPALCGGGPFFLLGVYHSTDSTKLLGHIKLSVPVDNIPPRTTGQIDHTIVTRDDWSGPRKLEYPKPPPAPQVWGTTVLPPAPALGAVPPHAPGTGQPGGGFAQPGQVTASGHDVNAAERAALARQREELLQLQHRTELEALKRESEARMTQMMASFKAEIAALAAQRPVEPPRSPLADLPALLSALTPIIAPILVGSREAAQRAAEQQQRSADETRLLMLKMLDKPAVDPMAEKIFDRMQQLMDKAKSDTPQFDTVRSMMEAMGAMSGQYMELVQAAAEMTLGGQKPEDSPMVKAVREGLKAVTTMMSRATPPPQQAPQFPQGVPPNAFPMPVQQFQPGPAPQLQPAPQFQSAPAQQPIPVQPANVQPLRPPIQLNGVTMSLIDKIEGMIRNKADPASVVRVFIENIEEPSIVAALVDVEGSIPALFMKRLGAWANDPANAAYAQEFMDEAQKQGEAAGLFEDDEQEGGDDDDNDDSDDGAAGYANE